MFMLIICLPTSSEQIVKTNIVFEHKTPEHKLNNFRVSFFFLMILISFSINIQ